MTYYLSIALLVLYYLLIFLIFFRVLLENRNPIKTQSYLLLLILLPVLGLIVYLFFGVNYRKQKLFSRKGIVDNQLIQAWQEIYEDRLEQNLKESPFDRLPVLFWRNSKAPVSFSNKIKVLNNGEEKFPMLLEKLSEAKDHIHMEYYIFEEGNIWNEVKELLIKKSREGVSVRVIYDSIGSNGLKNRSLRELRKNGVQWASYNPVIFTQLANKVNFRDHRKIVVIDGKIGFTGGVNLSDRYLNNGKHNLYWRDVHVCIEGEAVRGLQIQFFLNWLFTTKELLPFIPTYFPNLDPFTGTPTAIIGSQPDSDFASIMEAYYQMIHSAKKEVLIATPYFIPNSSVLTAIKVTAKSGVSVKLLLPGKSDSMLVQAASLSYVKELLENDVQVFLYERGMYHGKVLIIDHEICSIGTANMDYRSFDNNAEVNAFFFDKKIGVELQKDFNKDLQYSRKISLDEWRNRPFNQRFVGSLSRLAAPLL